MSPVIPIVTFAIGVVIVIVATEYLLRGLIGVAHAARISPFLASVVLSGMEAENIAVGLAAGARGEADVALGTAIGGGLFALTFAVGIGALIAPLRVRIPKAIILLLPASAVVAGLPLLAPATPRLAGVLLMIGFGVALFVLARAARGQTFDAERDEDDDEKVPGSLLGGLALSVAGIAVIAVGGELVAVGAGSLITSLGLGAGLVGMVITPIAIEAEEIARQVQPTRRGYADVAAGNTIGTTLWFVLFNLGIVSALTPVEVSDRVRFLDWPFLVGAALVAGIFLARGRIGRLEGATLVAIGIAFSAAHIVR